jgi:hypothetical protein
MFGADISLDLLNSLPDHLPPSDRRLLRLRLTAFRPLSVRPAPPFTTQSTIRSVYGDAAGPEPGNAEQEGALARAEGAKYVSASGYSAHRFEISVFC